MAVMTYANVLYQHYKLMEGMFRQGLSANAVQVAMTGMGMGYRRATVQGVRRQVLDVFKKEHFIAGLAEDELPKQGHLVELSWEKPRKYRILGELEFYDEVTGETVKQVFSAYDDTLRSRADYIRMTMDENDPKQYGKNFVLTGVTIKSIEHRKDMPY